VASPTSGEFSIGIVSLQNKATEFSFISLNTYFTELAASTALYHNLFSLPYPLIRLSIYEYPLSSLHPACQSKKFIILMFLGWLNNQTTQINLMTFIGFYFSFYILQIISILSNSSLTQDQNK
jgi:hypothetical protein